MKAPGLVRIGCWSALGAVGAVAARPLEGEELDPASVLDEDAFSQRRPVLAAGVPSRESTFLLQRAGTDPRGSGHYHLAGDGAKQCDYGVTLTETECKTVGTSILTGMKITPTRDYMVVVNLDTAPPGCSLHTKNDWAITYNSNSKGDNDGNFAIICHGNKVNVHAVKGGDNECDYGKGIDKVELCLAAVNKEITYLGVSTMPQQTGINVGHNDHMPPGCSMHLGSGATPTYATTIAWLNTKQDATNDGSYVLICTGTNVPTSLAAGTA